MLISALKSCACILHRARTSPAGPCSRPPPLQWGLTLTFQMLICFRMQYKRAPGCWGKPCTFPPMQSLLALFPTIFQLLDLSQSATPPVFCNSKNKAVFLLHNRYTPESKNTLKKNCKIEQKRMLQKERVFCNAERKLFLFFSFLTFE